MCFRTWTSACPRSASPRPATLRGREERGALSFLAPRGRAVDGGAAPARRGARFPALRDATARADIGRFSFLKEGVLARPVAWTMSEGAEGVVDLDGCLEAELLLAEAGGSRPGQLTAGYGVLISSSPVHFRLTDEALAALETDPITCGLALAGTGRTSRSSAIHATRSYRPYWIIRLASRFGLANRS